MDEKEAEDEAKPTSAHQHTAKEARSPKAKPIPIRGSIRDPTYNRIASNTREGSELTHLREDSEKKAPSPATIDKDVNKATITPDATSTKGVPGYLANVLPQPSSKAGANAISKPALLKKGGIIPKAKIIPKVNPLPLITPTSNDEAVLHIAPNTDVKNENLTLTAPGNNPGQTPSPSESNADPISSTSESKADPISSTSGSKADAISSTSENKADPISLTSENEAHPIPSVSDKNAGQTPSTSNNNVSPFPSTSGSNFDQMPHTPDNDAGQPLISDGKALPISSISGQKAHPMPFISDRNANRMSATSKGNVNQVPLWVGSSAREKTAMSFPRVSVTANDPIATSGSKDLASSPSANAEVETSSKPAASSASVDDIKRNALNQSDIPREENTTILTIQSSKALPHDQQSLVTSARPAFDHKLSQSPFSKDVSLSTPTEQPIIPNAVLAPPSSNAEMEELAAVAVTLGDTALTDEVASLPLGPTEKPASSTGTGSNEAPSNIDGPNLTDIPTTLHDPPVAQNSCSSFDAASEAPCTSIDLVAADSFASQYETEFKGNDLSHVSPVDLKGGVEVSLESEVGQEAEDVASIQRKSIEGEEGTSKSTILEALEEGNEEEFWETTAIIEAGSTYISELSGSLEACATPDEASQYPSMASIFKDIRLSTGSSVNHIGPKGFVYSTSFTKTSSSSSIPNEASSENPEACIAALSRFEGQSCIYTPPPSVLQWDSSDNKTCGRSNIILQKLPSLLYCSAMTAWNELIAYQSPQVLVVSQDLEYASEDMTAPKLLYQLALLGSKDCVMGEINEKLEQSHKLLELFSCVSYAGTSCARASVRRWQLKFDRKGSLTDVIFSNKLLLPTISSVESKRIPSFEAARHIATGISSLAWLREYLDCPQLDTQFVQKDFSCLDGTTQNESMADDIVTTMRKIGATEEQAKAIVRTLLATALLATSCKSCSAGAEDTLAPRIKAVSDLLAVPSALLRQSCEEMGRHKTLFQQRLCEGLYQLIHDWISKTYESYIRRLLLSGGVAIGTDCTNQNSVSLLDFPPSVIQSENGSFGRLLCHASSVLKFAYCYQHVLKLRKLLEREEIQLPKYLNNFATIPVYESQATGMLHSDYGLLSYLSKSFRSEDEIQDFLIDSIKRSKMNSSALVERVNRKNNATAKMLVLKLSTGGSINIPVNAISLATKVDPNLHSSVLKAVTQNGVLKSLNIKSTAPELQKSLARTAWETLNEFMESLAEIFPIIVSLAPIRAAPKIPWGIKCSNDWERHGFPLFVRISELPKYCSSFISEADVNEKGKLVSKLGRYIPASDFLVGKTVIAMRGTAYEALRNYQLSASNISAETKSGVKDLKTKKTLSKVAGKSIESKKVQMDVSGVWRGLMYWPKETSNDSKSTPQQESPSQRDSPAFYPNFLSFIDNSSQSGAPASSGKATALPSKQSFIHSTEDYLASWNLINLKGGYKGEIILKRNGSSSFQGAATREDEC